MVFGVGGASHTAWGETRTICKTIDDFLFHHISFHVDLFIQYLPMLSVHWVREILPKTEILAQKEIVQGFECTCQLEACRAALGVRRLRAYTNNNETQSRHDATRRRNFQADTSSNMRPAI